MNLKSIIKLTCILIYLQLYSGFLWAQREISYTNNDSNTSVPSIAKINTKKNVLLLPKSSKFEYGVTIINHGAQFFSSTPFGWMIEMAEAIRDRAGQARILKYNNSNGQFEELAGYDSSGETILLFDWVSESDNPAFGFSEAAGDALFSALLLGELQNDFTLENMHFIGHSRGCSVNSEAVERLLKIGVNVGQVTNLDPHDWGGGIWFPDDYDVNPNSLVISYPNNRSPNRGVVSWDGVGWSDTYWQTLGFGGRAVYGSYNLQLANIGHSEVHDWYLGTINGVSELDSWYGGSYPEREESGFNYSRIGGLVRPAEFGTKETLLFSIETDGIINGNFARGPTFNFNQYPGWSEHGGGGTGRVVNGKLELDDGNTWREHNRFYIPPNAEKIKFYFKVNIAEQGSPPSTDKLEVKIKTNGTGNNYQLLTQEYANTVTEKWIELDISQYKNSIATLLFSLEEGGGNGLNSAVQLDNVSLYLTPLVAAELKIFLEGAFSNGVMSNAITNDPLFPLEQPYDTPAYSYNGLETVLDIPDNVVDWILVELRDKDNNSLIKGRRSGFVLSDGRLVDLDGVNPISFSLPPDDYYVVISHRNHLSIMSANPVTFSLLN